MRRDDPRRGRGVCGVLGGGGGDLGYGYRGGVGREDGVRRAYLCEGAEDVELEGGDLGHSFNDKVDLCEGVHRCGWR